ncbi:hypothetical protein [Pseudomonas saxonica]|uniref:hypothetical protein n=1 Tax=Pseudomonas saxonica TaxID=2600598 RepID=UPI0013151D44|nr:hypothetical protein [Pseudomonas saxonica]
MTDSGKGGDGFPDYDDAGKLLEGLTRKISETTLAKDLKSKIQAQGDEPTDLL